MNDYDTFADYLVDLQIEGDTGTLGEMGYDEDGVANF